MKIALDYDGTYTADPAFWDIMISVALRQGHDIRVVTARDDLVDRTEPLVEVERLVPVIYTRGIAKRWYCEHFVDDFVPQIWIDDRPEAVLQNSQTSPEALAKWRNERNEGPLFV